MSDDARSQGDFSEFFAEQLRNAPSFEGETLDLLLNKSDALEPSVPSRENGGNGAAMDLSADAEAPSGATPSANMPPAAPPNSPDTPDPEDAVVRPEPPTPGASNGASNGTDEASDMALPPSGLIDDEDASFPTAELRDRVAIMLLFKQKVTQQDVARAWALREAHLEENDDARELWRFLTELPSVNREDIFAEAASSYAFDAAEVEQDAAIAFVEARQDDFTDEQWRQMRDLLLIPVTQHAMKSSGEQQLIFVTHDPTRKGLRRDIRDMGVKHFDIKYAPESLVRETIAATLQQRKNEYLERLGDDEVAHDFGASYEDETGLVDQEALDDEISRSSLINLFEATLVEAVRDGVSDIHIFPIDDHVEIHFRRDGELYCWHKEERGQPEAFFAVVKDNSQNVDRFERDDAQDGFIQRHIDDTLIRFRVSILPISSSDQKLRAESVVIRVLDDRKVITDLGQLGLQTTALDRFSNAINQPYGMVVLTGPTGSGKTTTLYAALHNVVTPKKNALTVEDPVEYILPGVRQLRLNHKLNIDRALRAILRHDPDIVMVGEMRDRETAELAIKLANTGHLTFSTLHTNDAPSAVSRLYKMGIEPFLIANAINLVMAQRLVRVLCPDCRQPTDPPEARVLKRSGFTDADIAETTFFRASRSATCKTCNGTGHNGRRAITETLPFTDDIRRIILTAGEIINEKQILEKATEEGMLTLQDSARNLVQQGSSQSMKCCA